MMMMMMMLNFAQRSKIRGQKGSGLGHVTYYISGMAKATNFKFCVQIDYNDSIEKIKIRTKEEWPVRHLTYF